MRARKYFRAPARPWASRWPVSETAGWRAQLLDGWPEPAKIGFACAGSAVAPQVAPATSTGDPVPAGPRLVPGDLVDDGHGADRR